MKIDQRELYVQGNFLETLKRCRGHYVCPKGGPLVAYAGTYQTNTPTPTSGKRYVGFEYFNCAQLEQYALVLQAVARELCDTWQGEVPDVVLGAPMGGIYFSLALANAFGCRAVFAEKEVVRKSDVEGGRDETRLVLKRHMITSKETVVIAEDVCNNFSTTNELLGLIETCDGIPYAVACMVNRSGRLHFLEQETTLPVRSLAYVPTEQYMQEHIKVSNDIQKGNICWHPKSYLSWKTLMRAMDDSSVLK